MAPKHLIWNDRSSVCSGLLTPPVPSNASAVSGSPLTLRDLENSLPHPHPHDRRTGRTDGQDGRDGRGALCHCPTVPLSHCPTDMQSDLDCRKRTDDSRGDSYLNWRTKARIRSLVARLPPTLSHSVHYWIQRRFGGLTQMNPVTRLEAGVRIGRIIVDRGRTP